MSRKPTLAEMLGHPVTQSAIQQLSQGMDPRLVAAKIAGDTIRDHLTKQLAAPPILRKKKPVTVDNGSDIIDAEFTVIPNSAPKRRGSR